MPGKCSSCSAAANTGFIAGCAYGRSGGVGPTFAWIAPRFEWTGWTSHQIEEYLSSGLWEGKSGAFGYQDRPGWLHIVEGSESNVIGLPLELLGAMLADLDS